MKKIMTFMTIAALSTGVFAAKFSTSELKEMDCATLSIEKKNAQTIVDQDTATPENVKKASKWAGMAGSALGAFGGSSDVAAKAGQMANGVAANNQQIEDSKANLENIKTYQKSKKCKI